MMARGRIAWGFTLAACGGGVANAPDLNPAPAAEMSATATPALDSTRASSPSSAPRLSLSAAGGCWLRDGRVWCWNGTPAELASASARTDTPSSLRAIPLPAAARDAAGTLRFGCALLASGGVHCWGDNTWGQLGAGSRALESERPLAVLGLDAATAIAVAAEHACAALDDGSVACWGNNTFGQCGHDREYAPAVRELVRPERVEGVRGARGVVVSAASSCALGEIDTWCWGELLRANDGSGPPTDRTRAARIAPLPRARALALGGECGCAITAEGRVACFALSMNGCPSPDVRAGLEPLFAWSDARALAVGDRGACAELAGGDLECWLHLSRELGASAPLLTTARPLPSSARGVPAMADGPCVLDGLRLACWSSRYWDEPAAGEPVRLRLP